MARSIGRRLGTFAVVALALAACGQGSSTPNAPGPGSANAVDGRFELLFTVDRTTLRPDDNVAGTAELWLRAGDSGATSGPGQMFGFEFAEVGGQNRGIAPVWDMDCSPHQVGSDTPLSSPIVKTGAVVDDFSRAFLPGREIHLPAGTWDVTAITRFHDGRECGGLLHEVRATVRVVVSG